MFAAVWQAHIRIRPARFCGHRCGKPSYLDAAIETSADPLSARIHPSDAYIFETQSLQALFESFYQFWILWKSRRRSSCAKNARSRLWRVVVLEPWERKLKPEFSHSRNSAWGLAGQTEYEIVAVGLNRWIRRRARSGQSFDLRLLRLNEGPYRAAKKALAVDRAAIETRQAPRAQSVLQSRRLNGHIIRQ